MSLFEIINGTTPCKFADINAAYIQDTTDMISLKYINTKYYIDNFNEFSEIKCKLIKNTKIIKSWEKHLGLKFNNSILFKIKLKDYSCFTSRYYSFVIEIIKNDVDINEFGLLTMNIFELIPLGTFNSKLSYINTYISQF